MRIGGGHGEALLRYGERHNARTALGERTEVRRSCAAAAAEKACTAADAVLHQCGELPGIYIEHRLTADLPRKPCVWLKQDGEAGYRAQLLKKWQHFARAQTCLLYTSKADPCSSESASTLPASPA